MTEAPEMVPDSDERELRLRWAGTCRLCGASIPKGDRALHQRSTRTVRCLVCPAALSTTGGDAAVAGQDPPPVPDASSTSAVAGMPVVEPTPGADSLGAGLASTEALAWSPPVSQPPAEVEIPAPSGEAAEVQHLSGPEPLAYVEGAAGASARREYERRHDSREQRVRENHPVLGPLALAIHGHPQSTNAWAQGAVGEETIGRGLAELAGEQLRVLHDRRIPGTRANIDHIVVTPVAVWVVDGKHYRGKPARVVEGGLFRPAVEKLVVDGRDRTKLVAPVHKQAQLVAAAVPGVTVKGCLCFLADWGMLQQPFVVGGVLVVWPGRLRKVLREEMAGAPHIDVADVQRRIAEALPPA